MVQTESPRVECEETEVITGMEQALMADNLAIANFHRLHRRCIDRTLKKNVALRASVDQTAGS